MSGVPLGHKAVGLAWLPPSADALLALTADPPDMRVISRDPALLTHILRFTRPATSPDQFALTPALLSQPSLYSCAATLLEQTGVAASLKPVRSDQIAEAAATVASELALQFPDCSPAAAVAATRLVPLGWYAIQAVDPSSIAKCLGEADFADHPGDVQHQFWGMTATAITRRLTAHWRIPVWLAATMGFLHLEVRDAVVLGAPESLFRVVKASIIAAESRFGSLGLTGVVGREELGALLTDAMDLAATTPVHPVPPLSESREAPAWLLARLLRATAEAKRATGTVWLAESETRVDQLATTLAELRAEFQQRVRNARLEGLAEFAAGASHEINNPLAVVRGHAQLLLAHEENPDRRRQLDAIIRQTRRVHDLLQGTLQFARPPRPNPSPVPLAEWLTRIVDTHFGAAEEKGVSLVCEETDIGVQCGMFDPTQARQALDHLIQNSIEIVPAGGWVRVLLECQNGMAVIAVEDSGPGPAEMDRDYLFDPFFSGRPAGRGRGLGLPIAWRLARINGGDVRYSPTQNATTRFELILPICPAITDRLSA